MELYNARIIGDSSAPRYHFFSVNWMNDPIPFWDGERYHIFFQHNPGAAVWGDMHWGHAVSRDLCRWELLPVALAPTPGGPDHDGVWTGCVTRDAAGQVTAIYTGIPRLQPFEQVHCLATSGDNGATWAKWPGNPITASKPEGYGPCFRDPQVFDPPFSDPARRYLVIGGEKTDRNGGVAYLYRADGGDLTRWEYLHNLYEGGTETGYDFECPDLFPVPGDPEGRYLLLTSRNKTWWHVGRLGDDLRFTREAYGPCDAGCFYAGKSIADGKGRRLLWGWLREERPEAEQVAAGWSGVLSLPRVVTAGPDGKPRFAPPEELEALRATPEPFQRVVGRFTAGSADEDRPLLPLPLQSEVRARLTPVPNEEGELPEVLGVTFFFEPGDIFEGLYYDTLGPALGGENYVPANDQLDTFGEELELAPGEPLDIHLFIDGSVFEFFVNGRQCWTQRRYPSPGAEQVTLCLNLLGGTVDADISAWRLAVPAA